MDLSALMTVGFLGLGFGEGGPIPIDAGVGASHDGDFNAPMVHLQPTERQVPKGSTAVTFSNFKPNDFPFVTTLPDDGTDKGGGWQVAKVNLEFNRIVLPYAAYITWYCPFSIEMPLRAEKIGKISPSLAASMSVKVTNSVGGAIDHELPHGIFCEKFRAETLATFKSMYPKLGARVTQ